VGPGIGTSCGVRTARSAPGLLAVLSK